MSRSPWIDHHRDLRSSQLLEHLPAAAVRSIETAGPSMPPGPAGVAERASGATRRPSLTAWRGSREPRHGRDRVGHERAGDAQQQRREEAGQADQPVPGVAHDGVDEHHGDRPVGLGGGQLGDQPPAHRVAGEAPPRSMPSSSSTRPSSPV